MAILEGRADWGVSCHFVDESFDTGDLVAVERFPIDPERATAFSLDLQSQQRLLELFEDVMGRVLRGEQLPREPQGEGRYVTREELEALRFVRAGRRRGAQAARASGTRPGRARVTEVDGRTLTLVDQQLLDELAGVYRDAGRLP